MMPHTVPNRPTKGDTEPTVARKPSWRLDAVGLAQDGDVHRLVDAVLDARRPGFRAGLPFSKARRHSRKAAMNIAAMG